MYRYREEFIANSDWLCFGFHAKDGKIDLSELSPKEEVAVYILATKDWK